MCATKTGAEIAGSDDKVGTLELGKLADLLIIDGNPFEDIRIMEDRSKFYAVIQNGIIKAGFSLHS